MAQRQKSDRSDRTTSDRRIAALAALRAALEAPLDEAPPLVEWRLRQIETAVTFLNSGLYKLSFDQAKRAQLAAVEIPPSELHIMADPRVEELRARLRAIRKHHGIWGPRGDA